MVRTLLLSFLALFAPLAVLAQDSWCSDGILRPDLVDDKGNHSVQLYVVQAPLFSKNPSIGKKMGYILLYHTAVIFSQGEGNAKRNWTLEFDSVTDVLGATLPKIEGDSLLWNNDARYCLTKGILWGNSHWSKMFQPVLTMTSDHVNRLFDEFVLPVNSSSHHVKPLYQLWNVKTHGFFGFFSKTLVGDITCGDGVGWLLHYCTTKFGLEMPKHFHYRYTRIIVNAREVQPVDMHNKTQRADVVTYFQGMSHVMSKGLSIMQRLEALWHVMPVRYIYDSNSDTYFHIIGNRFPWFWPEYPVAKLAPPPWAGPWSVAEPEVAESRQGRQRLQGEERLVV